MKSSFFLAFALFTGAAATAQTETTVRPQSDTTVVAMIDSSAGKAYISSPDRLLLLTTETLTSAHIFPALGTYKGSGTSTADVTIVLDETNKGIVWVEGLPQGRFKALMKRAPSTYKIPAQKAEGGKAIAEGILYVNPETQELTIITGKTFNDKEPTAMLTVANKKSVWQYTGVKTNIDADKILNGPVTETQNQ